MAFVPALPLTRGASASAATPLRMSAQEPAPQRAVSRRSLLAGAAAALAAAVVTPNSAKAEREYANVGYLGGGDVIDVNNANVRSYAKFRGFYPGLAGLIVANGPYKTVDEIYKVDGITDAMKKTLDEYKDQLICLEPTPEYELDKINNGLYR